MVELQSFPHDVFAIVAAQAERTATRETRLRFLRAARDANNLATGVTHETTGKARDQLVVWNRQLDDREAIASRH